MNLKFFLLLPFLILQLFAPPQNITLHYVNVADEV